MGAQDGGEDHLFEGVSGRPVGGGNGTGDTFKVVRLRKGPKAAFAIEKDNESIGATESGEALEQSPGVGFRSPDDSGDHIEEVDPDSSIRHSSRVT